MVYRRISNLYVEGLNLAGNQYDQITNGVNSDDISTVQVLQNNQPVKMLRGIMPSDQVDINLKLTEGRKNVWAVNSEGGLGCLQNSELGAPVSYGVMVSPMQFGKACQTLSSLLWSDNQLSDPSDENADLDLRRSNDYMTALSIFKPTKKALSNIPFFPSERVGDGGTENQLDKGGQREVYHSPKYRSRRNRNRPKDPLG